MLPKSAAVAERRRLLRVLIIDPDVEDVRRVRECLQTGGEFVTHAARTVAEGLTLLSDGMFDVALIDSATWSEGGSELAQHLREHRHDVAVVLLTGGENERDALPALKLGAHDFFSKAHLEDGQQLVLRIEGAFEENRSLRRRDTMVRWLEREARTDHLTGLLNRHAFDERLREACENARAGRRPVTLLMADICGTRIVNETYGHDSGDDMIRRAALGISRCIRGIDTAARIGGDEFAVLVDAVSGNRAIELAECILSTIGEPIEGLPNDARVVASIGIALRSSDGIEISTLMQDADAAMYAAKRNGRARWELNEPIIEV